MSLHKLQLEQVIQNRKITEELIPEIKDGGKSYRTKRRSITRAINHSNSPNILTSTSTKFIRKLSDKSPISQTKTDTKRLVLEKQNQKRRSMVCTPTQQDELIKNNKQAFYQNNQFKGAGLLESSLHDEINRIKALSRFMLDLKLPAALPTKPKKIKKPTQILIKQQGKPLIQVKMQRKNGFIRPTMLVRDPLQVSIQQKQPQKRIKNVVSKSKQKLKTAPASVQFGLHIKSHQQIFDQENNIKETKNQLIKRFRSTWTKKLSKSKKKLPEIQVSPWVVTEYQIYQ